MHIHLNSGCAWSKFNMGQVSTRSEHVAMCSHASFVFSAGPRYAWNGASGVDSKPIPIGQKVVPFWEHLIEF